MIPNGLEVRRLRHRLRTVVRPSLVWVRAFHSIYRPEMAIEALRDLHHDFPEARLTMLGPDKGDGSFQMTRRRAEALGVADKVQFGGLVPNQEIPRWLDENDVFLNTTDVDNMPLSVMEAMAAGLCVVTTDPGGIQFLITKGEALLVRPGCAEAMAKAVRQVLTEPGLSERLSREGRQLVERFDWECVIREWERLFVAVSSESPSLQAASDVHPRS